MLYDHRDETGGQMIRFLYQQEPYVRITLPDGATVDGKVMGWTRGKVLAMWEPHRVFL